jgi:hypothetical protein
MGTENMSASARVDDWQAVGIAQAGGADIVGAGIYCFNFRSLSANFSGTYLFIGAGVGLGGSLGGGTAPSPSQFVSKAYPNLYSPIKCRRPFSGDDLDMSYAVLETLQVQVAYGYSLTHISAGWVDKLFASQDASGWGTGVGAGGAVLVGIWKRI